MKPFILLLASILLFSACNTGEKSNQEILQEGISDGKATRTRVETQEKQVQEKKLRYLYYANGGLRGYFNDGTVAGCPHCDLLKANVEALYSEKPFDHYAVMSNGHLKLEDGTEETPGSTGNTAAEGWAIIDYRWTVELK